ncbi:hypothetical protein SERLA73DRAFT_150224 [Serpula lacrymans var. lacrymans S7.3]|uniref:Uncharacterized protein n=1 Tax=Serpula lacrymans var. lacrymans (strain S7.3) TaxID=936435 RepID=F8PLL2_SERL3|nr:hypothetical protein SERLA73DRAFT_150224 [Serpula lacrymans var. lacrymans S7.3]
MVQDENYWLRELRWSVWMIGIIERYIKEEETQGENLGSVVVDVNLLCMFCAAQVASKIMLEGGKRFSGVLTRAKEAFNNKKHQLEFQSSHVALEFEGTSLEQVGGGRGLWEPSNHASGPAFESLQSSSSDTNPVVRTSQTQPVNLNVPYVRVLVAQMIKWGLLCTKQQLPEDH